METKIYTIKIRSPKSRLQKKTRGSKLKNILRVAVIIWLMAVLFVLVTHIRVDAYYPDFPNVEIRRLDNKMVEGVGTQQKNKIEVVFEQPTPSPVNIPVYENSAEFKVTAYCACSRCCGVWTSKRGNGPVVGAAGTELIPGVSVAVDNSIYKFGTVFVDENGHKYIAADTGSGVKGNHIDIYFSDHDSACQWGVQYLTLKW